MNICSFALHLQCLFSSIVLQQDDAKFHWLHWFCHGYIGFSPVCVFKWIFQMGPQTACPIGCIGALVAFVWLSSTVSSQMLPQATCLRGCIVTLVAFVWLFFHCVFSNVSSNGLSERIQSHIGCICMALLHCVFSNVSSNRLHERMHSHIGCICLTFLHCAFSNVSSNCLPEKIQNHTVCICLAFFHCVFLNVSLNYLDQSVHCT